MTDKEATEFYAGLTPRQQLILYRGLYYNDGFVKEEGIVANAIKDILSQYYHQQSEIERLKSMNQAKLDTIHDLQSEVERLRANNKAIMQTMADIHTEAIEEFAEKSIEQVGKARQKYQRLCKEQGEEMEESMHIHYNGMLKIINNVKKEMEGEQK